MNYTLSTVSEITKKVQKQTEVIILEQLSDLIRKGLLIVDLGEMVMTTHFDSQKNTWELKVDQTCKLELKDKEYIEKLEKENEKLRSLVKSLQEMILEDMK